MKKFIQNFSEVFSKYNEQTKFRDDRLLLWWWVWDRLSLKRKKVTPLFRATWSKLVEWLPWRSPNWGGGEMKHPSRKQTSLQTARDWFQILRMSTFAWPEILMIRSGSASLTTNGSRTAVWAQGSSRMKIYLFLNVSVSQERTFSSNMFQ